MPLVLIIFGIVFILIGYQGTQTQFFTLVKGDFTGSGNFIYWIGAIGMIGAVGFIPKMKPISDGFLVLVLLVFVLKDGTGFFDNFQTAISGANATTATAANENAAQSAQSAITPSFQGSNLYIGSVGGE